MEKVTAILSKKQYSFNRIHPTSSLRDALYRMSCENFDYLIVMDEEERYLGILSEHEIASKMIFNDSRIDKITVRDVMNTRLPVVQTDETVEDCIKLMRQFNVRYLPVFEDHDFCGIVSSDEILQEVISHRTVIFDDEGEPVF